MINLEKLHIDPDKIKSKVKDYVKNNKKRLKLVAVLLLVMWSSAQIKGCIAEWEANYVPPRPVSTALAVKKDIPLFVESFGTLTSPEDVDIKAQVTGKILEANFTQGTEVSAGDLLFTIDPREYAAEVEKAKASLAQDQSDLQLKKDLLERNRTLFDKKLLADQMYEQYQTDVAVAAANVELDKAALELAQINLECCYIRSPINGLAGKRQVDVGNIVSANTGPTLVNVKSIDKLYVDFTLPERDLPKVRKAMEAGTLKLGIVVEGDEENKYEGQLDFVDNSVDDETGTFSLRATVDNSERKLWPGQFVDVRLFMGEEKGAVVVPYEAAQIGKQGYFVFVVERGSKVALKPITVGEKYKDDIIAQKGVDAGDIVVTEGLLGLRPGTKIYDMSKEERKNKRKAKAKGDSDK